MLRQIWRQRGAYNVVNLPLAASQDDPGSAPGRADRSSDWRRHYNPSLEPEFREDVGLEAWDRPDWYTDRRLNSTAAAKILRRRLEAYGPQKERSLQEVIARIRSEKDAEMALKAAELFRRYRASREQHTPFKSSTSKMIIERALEVDAGAVVVQALSRKDELGFNFTSLKAYRQAITHFSTKRDLKNALKVYELAKKQGMNTNRDITYCALRACLDCDRPDMAFAYALEFQQNGLRISPAQREKIEAATGKKLPVGKVDGSEEGGLGAKEEGKAGDEVDVEREASVSSTGEGETVVVQPEGPKVVPEAAIEGSDVTPPGASSKVAAVVSVEADSEEDASPEATEAVKAGPGANATSMHFAEVPGLEEAVAAKMRQLFPPKATPERSDIRRANSI